MGILDEDKDEDEDGEGWWKRVVFPSEKVTAKPSSLPSLDVEVGQFRGSQAR